MIVFIQLPFFHQIAIYYVVGKQPDKVKLQNTKHRSTIPYNRPFDLNCFEWVPWIASTTITPTSFYTVPRSKSWKENVSWWSGVKDKNTLSLRYGLESGPILFLKIFGFHFCDKFRAAPICILMAFWDSNKCSVEN